jgi:hypothetical protein
MIIDRLLLSAIVALVHVCDLFSCAVELFDDDQHQLNFGNSVIPVSSASFYNWIAILCVTIFTFCPKQPHGSYSSEVN